MSRIFVCDFEFNRRQCSVKTQCPGIYLTTEARWCQSNLTDIYTMKLVVLSLLCFLLWTPVAAADACLNQEPPDEREYTFSYETDLKPYSFRNADGEADGFYVDVMKFICNIMNKKCKALLNTFSFCWDNTNTSRALNNRWWDVCGAAFQTAPRRSAIGFVTEYTGTLTSYVFVKKGSAIHTAADLKNSAIGFVKGWWLSPSCLASTIGVALEGRMKPDYMSFAEMQDGVLNGEVDAMVIFPDVVDHALFDRVDTEPIYCTLGGVSMMVRKDMMEELSWIDEGVQKLKENGDYKWMCNLVRRNTRVDPAC